MARRSRFRPGAPESLEGRLPLTQFGLSPAPFRLAARQRVDPLGAAAATPASTQNYFLIGRWQGSGRYNPRDGFPPTYYLQGAGYGLPFNYSTMIVRLNGYGKEDAFRFFGHARIFNAEGSIVITLSLDNYPIKKGSIPLLTTYTYRIVSSTGIFRNAKNGTGTMSLALAGDASSFHASLNEPVLPP